MGFAYSFYFYRDSKKSHELTIGFDPTYIQNNIYYFYIWNSGNKTIYKEDIITKSKAIEIEFDEKNKVEYANIEEKTSEYFSTDILHDPNYLEISFDFLRPDEGFTLMLKKNNTGMNYIHFELKHKKNTLKLPNVIKSRGITSNLNLSTNLINYCTLVLLASGLILEGINFNQINDFQDIYTLVLRFLALLFLLYITPTMFRRIRAPRPPKELKLHYLKNG